MRIIRLKSNPSIILAAGEALGEFSYDATKFEEIEGVLPPNWEYYKETPLAMGIDLIDYINKATIQTIPDDEAFILVEKVQPFLLFLAQGRCNPLAEDTFLLALQILDTRLTNSNKQTVMNLIEKWKKEVRFVQAASPKSKKK